ncbi:MAG: FtsX-like permease family protein [Micromonosporaceae bacterium]|nr:FtsX-like permease family protein [Micromonosporaceae bacterium]
MRAVRSAALAAVRRRRLQTLVVGAVTLLSVATSLLGVGLLAVSDAPFEHAFAGQAGAHAVASFDPGAFNAATAGAAALASTAHRPGVTAAAGPFDTAVANLFIGSDEVGVPNARLVARPTAGGPVDRLSLDSGHWLTGPGQIVIARQLLPPSATLSTPIVIGRSTVTVRLPHRVSLRIVGVAESVTGTADAWIWPGQDDVLHAGSAQPRWQMLYRFAAAADPTALRQSLATATAELPSVALLDYQTYLASKLRSQTITGPVVPFVVAFAVLGLVAAVLVVGNVVSGAVSAGTARIGVLRSLGCTPGQVVIVYIGQTLVPAIAGAGCGVLAGAGLTLPIVARTQRAYDLPTAATLPAWAWPGTPLAVLLLVGLTAAAAAARAGRISPVQAIALGRAPRAGRGYRVRRLLAASRLPRPVAFGLGTLAARPARALATLLAVSTGAATVVFAVGLSSSLTRYAGALTRVAAVPVAVRMYARQPTTGGAAAVRAVIAAQPGTAHVVGDWHTTAQVGGLDQPVRLTGYQGDATWTGYQLISGRWYAAAGEVVAGSRLLRLTGTGVGDTITIATGTGQVRVRVVGESFDNANQGLSITGDAGTLIALAPRVSTEEFEVGLAPGVDARAYQRALAEALDRAGTGTGADAQLRTASSNQQTIMAMLGLAGTLTLVLAFVAALGVLNTVVLSTRERVYEIGVLKSIGMTPRQTRTMVVGSVVGIGVLAGLIALPVGWAVHRAVLPLMGAAAGTGIPPSLLDVYRPGELAVLAAAGVLLAVLGALPPASWAARTHPAATLRAE